MNVPVMIFKYHLRPTGVIQAGSHHGEEIPIWEGLRIPHVHFEPIISNCSKLLSLYPKANVNCLALGDRQALVEMHTETVNGGQSCSVLRPLRHLQLLNWIVFDGKQTVPMNMLDDCWALLGDTPYNFMYVDVQGYELQVFKGAAQTIASKIDFIFTEVNRTEVYEGCSLIEDVDRFLGELSMSRVETEWHGGEFGDALYVRNELL